MSTTTQITFIADSNLKDLAMNKEKSEGITLKALLTMAMRSYVDNALSVKLAINPSYDKLFADTEIVDAANKLGNVLQSKKI